MFQHSLVLVSPADTLLYSAFLSGLPTIFSCLKISSLYLLPNHMKVRYKITTLDILIPYYYFYFYITVEDSSISLRNTVPLCTTCLFITIPAMQTVFAQCPKQGFIFIYACLNIRHSVLLININTAKYNCLNYYKVRNEITCCFVTL